MIRMGRAIVLSAVLWGAVTCPMAHAGPKLIQPTVILELPQISFDANINPVAGVNSTDAQNIIRAHGVALQQVQAAIRYLQVYRSRILTGKDTFYNKVFGDFYNPASQFAGLYNRVLKHDTGRLDRFGNPVYELYYNTSHYDRVMFVFLQIQAALQNSVTYAWGAQTGDATFNTYRTGSPATVGDPLFGSPSVPDNINQVPLDPVTGLPIVDPVTGLPFVNQPLLGNSSFNNAPFALAAGDERGLLQWGDSTSYTPKHITQLNTAGSTPLRWDADNDDNTNSPVKLSKEQELAFFKERLDTYATAGGNIFVGGAFLTEEQRSNSNPDGTPNPFFHPTDLNQFQMIIAALAQSDGSLPGAGAAVGATGVAIEPGLLELFGQSAYFFEALDSKSYAQFSDLFNPDGLGDGSLLPPPGKNGTTNGNFVPFVFGS